MKEGMASPAEIFEEPYPCQGCEHWKRCEIAKLSCRSFYIYVTERGRLDLNHRTPNSKYYRRTFEHRAKADRDYEARPLTIKEMNNA